MREFYKGWKRKVGCVTLLIACVFVGGWIRSISIGDGFDMGRIVVGSLDGSIVILCQMLDSLHFPEWSSNDSRGAKEEMKMLHDAVTGWRLRGLMFGRFRDARRHGDLVWIVPYAYFVVPLTLLSAYLLASKPRPLKQPSALTASSEPASTPSPDDPFQAESISSRHS